MDPTARRRRTMLIATITGGLILILLVGVGVYGLIRGPQPTEPLPTTPTREPSANQNSLTNCTALTPAGPATDAGVVTTTTAPSYRSSHAA